MALNGEHDALVIAGLEKSYFDGDARTRVLHDLHLSIPAGVSMTLTGPSGSGKSTLLNIVAGLAEFDAGAVTVNRRDQQYLLHQMSERQRTRFRRRHVGYIHQFFNLVPTLTTLENVCLPAVLNKQANAEESALQLLEEFGLTDRQAAFPEEMSGGEQQRVAVARALITQPVLLLADEPTGNLDADNSLKVADMLFKTAKMRNITLVIATHNESIAVRGEMRCYLDKHADPVVSTDLLRS